MSTRVIESAERRATRISPKKFAHAVFYTPSLPRMRDWYVAVLEARIVHRDELLCFLTYDDEHHRIALAAIPGLQPRAAGLCDGLAHIAFTYADLGDLLFTYKRLKRAGIEPYWPINHGPTLSLYYRDPDGNKVELQVDSFADVADSERYMSSAAFASNPIGVIYDPEELAARYEAGEPLDALLARPDLAPGKTPLDMLRA